MAMEMTAGYIETAIKRGLQAIVAALIAFTSGCGRPKASITMAGSTAFEPFAVALSKEYKKIRPDVRITVQGGGSSLGIMTAMYGIAQIGMADLVKLPQEAVGLTATVVARDGIAMVVNVANPVTDITEAQVRDIFNGKLTNWRELGWEDHSITVVSREAGSGTRSSFEKLIGGIVLVKSALVQDSNGSIRETVINDKYSISYLSHGLINQEVRSLSLDGCECTAENIIGGKYKLSRPVFLLTKGEPAGIVKDFIDYMLSHESQEIIHKKGLLPAK